MNPDLMDITAAELGEAMRRWFVGADPDGVWPTQDPSQQAALATGWLVAEVQRIRGGQ